MSDRYRINEPQAACDIIDGEAVFIDFVSGSYFSVTGSGAEIVEMLRHGLSESEITAAFRDSDRGFTETSTTQIQSFIEVLLTEQLIVRQSEKPNSIDAVSYNCRQFSPPGLEKFDDLQDLLLLDPIHDVDGTGWPARKVA